MQLTLNYFNKIKAQPHHIAYSALNYNEKFNAKPRSSKPLGFRAQQKVDMMIPLPPLIAIPQPTNPRWVPMYVTFNSELSQLGHRSTIPQLVLQKFLKHIFHMYSASRYMHLYRDGS